MKKRRGHYCRICGSLKPNEAFSGKGHRVHVCKKCARLPKEKREEIERTDEIFNYLRQSHISDKNVSRLRKLAKSPNEQVAELAGIVLEVAEVKPYKKRRLKEIARKRQDLLQKRDETGLILAHGL
jgi:ribosome-binding protein aMBF1 (putative translation factor)